MIKSKHFLLLLWFVLLVGEVFSQNGIVARKGLSAKQKTIEILREEYPSAFQEDINESVVPKDKEEVYGEAWKEFLQNLGSYLSKNGMKWEDNGKIYNIIFVESNGTIDYYFYRFKNPSVPSKKQVKQFRALVKKYISTHSFNYTANRQYNQCGSVTFFDR